MVARVPALFDPLVTDWRTRLAALRQARAAATEDPARLFMKKRVLHFLLSQYSNPLLRYAKPLDLVSSIPAAINLHPELQHLLQKAAPPPSPATPALKPPIPQAPPKPVPAARPLQTGILIFGPIRRSIRDDFITILCFDLGWPVSRATAIANLVNKKSASFIETSPLIAERLRRHLLPYHIQADILPRPNIPPANPQTP